MNENKPTNAKTPSGDEQASRYFAYATFCALPSIVTAVFLLIYSIWGQPHNELLIDIGYCLIFGWPFWALAGVIGLVFVVLAWRKSRWHCWWLLLIYSAAIIFYFWLIWDAYTNPHGFGP